MEKRYKTEPFKLWNKAKQMRVDFYRDIAEAKDKGKLLIGGGTEGLIAIPTGFDHVFFGGEPYGASVAHLYTTNPAGYQEIAEATEHAGYPRDLCAYMRNYLGSLLLDKYLFGGNFPKLDFCLQSGFCDTHYKWYQIVSELEGVPYFAVDLLPFDWEGSPETEKTRELKIEYAKNQVLEAIEWMIKTTGREFDDEKFIEGVSNEFESTSLWARICLSNRAIPAPLDEKSMFTFYILLVLARPQKKVVDFYKELLAEMEYRVENKIAANPYERCRLLSDSQPPWSGLSLYRLLEDYGAVSVGAHYTYGLSGGWEYNEVKDTWDAARTPQERGIELKSREDAARALSEWWLRTGTVCRTVRRNGAGRIKRMMDLIDKWHVDGVMIHLNRGCEGMAMGQMELARALMKNKVPTLTFEGNNADPREFDEQRTHARIESFMETLGLKKIIEN